MPSPTVVRFQHKSDIVIYECRIYDPKMNLIRVIPEVRLEEYVERPLPKKLSLKFGEKE